MPHLLGRRKVTDGEVWTAEPLHADRCDLPAGIEEGVCYPLSTAEVRHNHQAGSARCCPLQCQAAVYPFLDDVMWNSIRADENISWRPSTARSSDDHAHGTCLFSPWVFQRDSPLLHGGGKVRAVVGLQVI